VVLLAYWLICGVFAVGVVYWKGMGPTKTKATSTDRKYFHFLILAVYLPGVLIDRNLLYLSSAALLYIFVLVEVSRKIIRGNAN
jgi:dolichol kinase